MPVKEKIFLSAEKHFTKGVEIRRHLHRFPELSFQEFRTTEFLMNRVLQEGINEIKKISETGFYFDLFGSADTGKNILLRADIDALPIQEAGGRDYGSCIPGVMHACGHDVHTACVFSAFLILRELKNDWGGMVRVVFQPGEEKSPGGASVMIKNGLLSNPSIQQALALHVHPDLPVGKAGFCAGPFMAASDEVFINIHGKGGHAALRNQYKNPIPVASGIISRLTQELNQNEDLVFAIGKLSAEGATNVIPSVCKAEGTLRSFNEKKRADAKTTIQETARKFAEEAGCLSEVYFNEGYPVLINDQAITAACRSVAEDMLGVDGTVCLPQRFTAEDFAFIAQKVPSCFFRLGVGNPEKGIGAPVHTPEFDADERCILYGSALLAAMCMELLK
jgi:amidohydrolase